jgi:hypothetical protein
MYVYVLIHIIYYIKSYLLFYNNDVQRKIIKKKIYFRQ